jgi:aspartate/methionine/tyrosine aminotransferase
MGTERYLARRSSAVQWSGIRVMFALADEIPDVINLGIGQPDFDTPTFIREAARKALDEGYTRYPPAKGFRDLRVAIAKKLEKKNQIVADPDSEIFVSVGAMQGVFNTILHLVDPGDEVVVIDPGYDYYSQIGLFGGIPVPVPAYEKNNFKVDPDDIQKTISNKTKLLIVNTPSNPTGAILDEEILQTIANIALRHGIFVLSDEPYEGIVFDGKRHISIGAFEGMKELTISLYTLSKTYAMTGWRVGYVVANKTIIDEMEKLMEHMVSGVTSVAQRAALAAIEGPQDCVREMVEEYEKRRKVIHEGLNDIEGVSCILPESTFYAFPNITRLGMTSWDFARYLVKEHRVAVVPGSVFGKRGEGYVRVSFAADIRTLREAVSQMKKGIEYIHRGHTYRSLELGTGQE